MTIEQCIFEAITKCRISVSLRKPSRPFSRCLQEQFYSYVSQGLPGIYTDPWGLRVTPPFVFPARPFLGRGTFGTHSPLAFAVPAMTLFATGDIIHHRAQQIERGRSNVASVHETMIICCVLFSACGFPIHWIKQCLI